MSITAVANASLPDVIADPPVKARVDPVPPKPDAALTPNPQITFDAKLHLVVLEFRNEAGTVTRYPDTAKVAAAGGGIDSTA